MAKKKERGKFVVTGGARGIGRAIAERLAKDGAAVAILDTDLKQGPATAKRLGRASRYVPCDLANPRSIRAAARELQGFGRLDGLINNAGIGAFKPIETLSVEDWDKVLNVNLRAALLCVQAFLPAMKKGGSVLNIASTRALMSEPGGEAYGASKGGLLALTHAMAVSLQKHSLRVNAILPGWIDTSRHQGPRAKRLKLRQVDHDQHPSGRVGKPEDVAEAAAFLLDQKKAGFITGQRLVIDGGMTIKMIYIE
jgi:NAD(P)-dependent dehydrogenase (short-subunit alcohol dehydrogenase family)